MSKDVSKKYKARVYLAAPWVDRERMEDIASIYTDHGYDITHRWWFAESKQVPEAERLAFLKQCGNDDINGVLDADHLVVYNTAKSEGKAVEQGIAIGAGIPIIMVGKLGEFSNNVFHYTNRYHWVNNTEEAIEELENYYGE